MITCRLFVVIILCAIIAPSAGARIGDTVTQIEARFGKPDHEVAPMKEGRQHLAYHFKTYNVNVVFRDGLSAWEAYEMQQGGAVPDAFFHAVLDENGGKAEFTVKRSNNGQVEWQRKDGKITATRSSGGGFQIGLTGFGKGPGMSPRLLRPIRGSGSTFVMCPAESKNANPE
ncbi:MAG: hypothetical protein QOH88_2757 [Verrucomicrobiota bacterium]|jgi:hypothetical protein